MARLPIMIKELKEMLVRHEGEVNHAYPDSEGYITIGVGRLIDKRLDGGISHDEAMFLLDNDIQEVIKDCHNNFGWFSHLDDERKIVIINMVFNMGINRFKGFKKTIGYISNGEYSMAAEEMLDSKWADQVGKRAIELSHIMRDGKL